LDVPGVYLPEAHRHGVILPDRPARWHILAGLTRILGFDGDQAVKNCVV